MNLRALRSLVAIVDLRTFAAAAEELGLSQSAISLQIKGLEEDLGITIFDRNRRPPTLTFDGLALIPRARELLQHSDRMVKYFREPTRSTSLSLGAVPTVATGILPATLAALRLARPHLHIRVTTGLSHELARRVTRGELDLALISEPEEPPRGLTWQMVAAEPLMVIVPDEFAGGDPDDLLTRHPFIRFQRFAWASRLIDGELRRRGISVNVVMELDSLEGISLMVANGLGISIVPQRTLPVPFPDRVHAVPFGSPPLFRNVGIIQREVHPRLHLVACLQDVLTHVVAAAVPKGQL